LFTLSAAALALNAEGTMAHLRLQAAEAILARSALCTFIVILLIVIVLIVCCCGCRCRRRALLQLGQLPL